MRLNLKVNPAFYYIKEAFRLGSKGGSRTQAFFDYYGLVRGLSLPEAIKHMLYRIHHENKFPYHFSCIDIKCQVTKTKQLTKNKKELLVDVSYKYNFGNDKDNYFNQKKQYWIVLEKKNSTYFKWSRSKPWMS